MISNNDASKKYRTATEITSTRKTKQVVMLYDGIIKFLNEAKEGIEEKNVEKRFNGTDKAGKIIDGLNSCLDPEKGKEITVLLDDFYSGIFIRIMNLNFEKDSDLSLKNCIQIIEEIKMMRDAWYEIDEKVVRGEIDTDSALQQAPKITSEGEDEGGFEGFA